MLSQTVVNVLHPSITWAEKIHRWHIVAVECWQKGGRRVYCPSSHHPTQPNPAKISDKEINFLDNTLFKGERFNKQGILNIGTHFFAHRNFPVHSLPATHHRLLRTNSSAKSFIENITQFKIHLCARDYPNSLVERTMSKVEFSERQLALQQRETMRKNILPFVITFVRTSIWANGT